MVLRVATPDAGQGHYDNVSLSYLKNIIRKHILPSYQITIMLYEQFFIAGML